MRPLGICRLAVSALATPLIGGCNELFSGACDTGIAPGVVAEIRDAHSGAPLADSAYGVVVDGVYSDSLQPFGFANNGALVSRHAADERAGSYSVVVARPGYANWSTSGVRLRSGNCHVSTVTLQVRLVPKL